MQDKHTEKFPFSYLPDAVAGSFRDQIERLLTILAGDESRANVS